MTERTDKQSRFAGIGGHHSHKAGTVEWLTPIEIIGALGPFDLDPCVPVEGQPWPTAARTFSRRENGLLQQWNGRTWLNPPYANGIIEKWLARMADHNHGTALIFARTETDAFFRFVWERATALLFMRGRINFHFGEPWTDPKTGTPLCGRRSRAGQRRRPDGALRLRGRRCRRARRLPDRWPVRAAPPAAICRGVAVHRRERKK